MRFDWLDDVLRAVPYRPDDIDLAWLHLLEEFVDTVAARTVPEVSASALVGQLLEKLPTRTLEKLADSELRSRLEQEFGIQLDAHFQFVTPTADGVRRLTIPERELRRAYDRAARRLLVDRDRTPTYQEEGLTFTLRPAESGFLLTIQAAPTLAIDSGVAATPVQSVRNLLLWLSSPEPLLRLRAWQSGDETLQRLEGQARVETGSVDRWLRLKAGLESDEEATWQEAGEACKRLLFGQPGFVADLIESALALAIPQAIAYVIEQIALEDVACWAECEPKQLSDEQSLAALFQHWSDSTQLLARRCREDQDRHLPDLICHLRLRWLSIFPDAVGIREAALLGVGLDSAGCSALAAPGEFLQAVTREILATAEQSASPSLKANAALFILSLCQRAGVKAVDMTARDGQPVSRHLAGLIRAGTAWSSLPAPAPQGENQQVYAALSEALTRALYASWAADSDKGSMAARRYLAHVGGELLLTRLADSGTTRQSAAAVVETLDKYSEHRLLRRFMEKPEAESGFFRPELNRYLRYVAAYLAKQGERLRSDLMGIADDSLRQHLMSVALFHGMCYTSLAFDPNAPHLWLDDGMDTTTFGGLKELLESETEADRSFWPESQRAALDVLRSFDPEEQWKSLRSIIAGEDEQMASHFLSFFSLGAYNPTRQWPHRVADLLRPDSIAVLRMSPRLYRQFLDTTALVVLLAPADAEGYDQVQAFLLAPIDTTAETPEQAAARASSLRILAERGFGLDAISQWLRNVASRGDVELETKRLCIRAFTESWNQFPPDAQQVLGDLLAELKSRPELHMLLELRRFAK